MADLILYNGNCLTMDPEQKNGTAIAIRENKIMAVGADGEILPLANPDTEMVDLAGRTVTPGLVDSHVHFMYFALGLKEIDVLDIPDKGVVLSRVAEKASTTAPGEWLTGRGWKNDLWADRSFPTAADLDAITTDHPVFLRDKSGHAGWVNTMALKMAGIDRATPDPEGGAIQRDADGNATGILFETAMDLIRNVIPDPTNAQIVEAMRDAQVACWEVGLTGVHDFDGPDCFRALQTLNGKGELGLRVYKNIPAAMIDHAVALGLQTDFGDEWLRIGGVKIFADGALGPNTALMIEPYEGTTDQYGIAVVDKEDMALIASKASANNLSVTIHAIGDKANHDVLDVYEAVRKEEAERGTGQSLRHRIEHVQVLHPEDVNRLAELNVVASMQPIHATSDMEMADRYWGDRAAYSYAWRMMQESGALVVFGSDCPVEPIDPMLGIYAAVTRKNLDGTYAPDGWRIDQVFSLQETLEAFTLAAAQTSGQTDRLGSITEGKLADLTIFNRSLEGVDPELLKETKVVGTVINGEFKYRVF